MIAYDKAHRLFVLDNGSIGYAVYHNDMGYLETVYFGGARREYADFACIRAADGSAFYDLKTGAERTASDGFLAGVAPLELSPHALWDKRGAPVVLRGEDGSYETDLRYVSYRIFRGTPALEGLPCARGDRAETLELILEDAARGAQAHLFYTLFETDDVLLKHIEIVNIGKAPLRAERVMSMQLDLPDAGYDVVHFAGRWGKERDYIEHPLHDGVQEISSALGRSSAEENPLVIFKAHGADERQGEAIGFNLVYSGNFKFRALAGRMGGVHITYGINDEDFCWTLAPQEKFVAPQAVIARSERGLNGLSAVFHRFVRGHIIRWQEREPRPVLFNSWEGCTFDFDTDRILSYVEGAAKIGTQLFVLDDGWFGDRCDDRRALGDWRVNLQKVDLHRVIEACHARGMRFGIWFEPEMVSYDSDLFRAHPEYALGVHAGRRELYLMRHQLHLDFTNAAAVDAVYAQMKAFLQEYPVDYIKWDYNRTVAEHVSAALPAERQGEVYHRLVLGCYRLIDRLTREYPNILFEGCASGGGRFDLGMLCYCPQIWCSDESDPAQRMDIQCNTSYGYPLSAIGSHVNDSPVASYRTKAALALFGTYGYEMDPARLTEAEIADLNAVAALYRKYHRSVIEEGTLYRLRTPHAGNYLCMQCVSQDRSASLVLFMNRLKEMDMFRFVRLEGLDDGARYHNDFDGSVHTGEYYRKVGLNFSREWLSEFDCRLVLLTRED